MVLRTPGRVDELAGQVQGIRSEVDGLAEQLRPLPGRITDVGTRLEHRLTDEAGILRREFRDTLQQELRPVTSSIADLADAVRGRPEKSEVSALVDLAVAPTEKRLGEALLRLREENELLAEEGEEQRRRVRAYRPGTIEELRQRVEEIQKDLEERRADLTKAYTRIDLLERDNAHLKESTGAVDREELGRIRQQIAKEREDLESTKQISAERDELRAQVADYRKLEDRYRAAQEVKQHDIRLEEQLREAEKQRTAIEAELTQAKDDARKLQRRFDTLLKTHQEVQQRNQDLATTNETLKADVQRLAEQVTALETAVSEHAKETEARARERRELIAWRTKEEQALAVRRRELDADSRAGIEAQDVQHADRMSLLDAEHARRQEAVEAQVRAEVTEGFERDLRQAQRERESANEQCDRAVGELGRLGAELSEIRGKHVEWEARQHERALELQRHQNAVADLTAQREKLRNELDGGRDELRRGLEERDRLFGEKDAQHAHRLDESRAQVRNVEEALAALESRAQGARDRLADVDRQYQDELQLVQALHAERRRLEEPATREVRVKSMKQAMPGFAASERGRAPEELDEMRWLDQLEARIRGSEFVFPRRLLEAYHTSLKITHWSPLTVLAGMSGTGKSALSRLYAHFGGLRFHMVPVQPNWDSPQDLFGFFNHIDGLYKATPLLRALVQSQTPPHEGGFEDGLLLVGLDEMNLARVEYYGSELLSRWEARRDGVEAEALQLDIGHGEHESVKLGSNVLWVGTMNEDETTLSLSDKVLERGNVITFPRPKSLRRRDRVGLGAPGPWLSAKTFAKWTVEPSGLREEVRDKLKDTLEDMNHKLGLVHRSVSHRILQAIENYVANHPRVQAQAKADTTDKWWKRAFADQLVQKVMPKLRGLDNHTGKGKQCLEGVERILSDCAEELIPDFREARKPPQFLWVSAGYLEADEELG